MKKEQTNEDLKNRWQLTGILVVICFIFGMILWNIPASPLIGKAFGYGGGGAPVSYNPPIPPSAGFSVVINDGEIETDSQEVILTLNGGPDTERMAISNFSNLRYPTQEPYQTTKPWTLTEGEEEKTVYVNFYTCYGWASDVVSDSITLVASPSPLSPEAVALSSEAERIDTNQDEVVDVLDFNALMVNWGATVSGNIADFNDDNMVDIFDFNLLMINWTP